MVLAAIALVAIVAWPFLGAQRASAARPYFAPVLPDYARRDQTVAFFEHRTADDPRDQISANLLAGQYMQRYREALDIGDVLRARHQAERALVLQPQNNEGAHEVLGSAFTALHDFKSALREETVAHRVRPRDSNALAQMASLQMELGDYPAAAHDLSALERLPSTPTTMAVRARYLELTGKLAEARDLLSRAAAQTDTISDNSAVGRAWFHFRAGELAFSAGDVAAAQAQERTALTEFPSFEMAYRALARFCWAAKDWHCALDASTKGAAIVPDPETLGYQADAMQALGDTAGSAQVQQLIFAIERIGNAYRVNDRLLSVYYAEHGVRLDDAYRIALREVAARGDEIYAQDTLAWAAAMSGRWAIADRASHIAVRHGTQDPRIAYHAGMIALHFGRTAEAKNQLQRALALNPTFDPFYADRAKTALARLL